MSTVFACAVLALLLAGVAGLLGLVAWGAWAVRRRHHASAPDPRSSRPWRPS